MVTNAPSTGSATDTGIGGTFLAWVDSVVSPTFVPDLVKACIDLVIDAECGIWHLANDGAVSWLDFGRIIAEALNLDPDRVRPASPEQLGWRARRPLYSALRSERGAILPPLSNAISRHADARRLA